MGNSAALVYKIEFNDLPTSRCSDVFSWGYCRIFKNTFFIEKLRLLLLVKLETIL